MVTGANGGIGHAICKRLIEEGMPINSCRENERICI